MAGVVLGTSGIRDIILALIKFTSSEENTLIQ